MSNLNDDYWHSLIKNAAGLHESNSGSQDFAGAFLSPYPNVSEAVETRLAGKKMGGQDQVRRLAEQSDTARLASLFESEPENYPVGTKVTFASTTEALFSYPDAPEPKSAGEVVSVKTASGSVTQFNGKVFVRWEDGKIRGIAAKHLTRQATGMSRQATPASMPNMMRVASMGDLSNFLKIGSDTLVHKATKDLWKLSQDSSGYKIERLFNDTGSPLKV